MACCIFHNVAKSVFRDNEDFPQNEELFNDIDEEDNVDFVEPADQAVQQRINQFLQFFN